MNNVTVSSQKQQLNGFLEIKSSRFSGLSKTQIKRVKSDINDADRTMAMDLDVFTPEFNIEATYNGNITANKQKLTPNGFLNITACKLNLKKKIKYRN